MNLKYIIFSFFYIYGYAKEIFTTRHTTFVQPYYRHFQLNNMKKIDFFKLQSNTKRIDIIKSLQIPQKDSPLKLVWRFTRPHTLIATALSIPSIYIYATPSNVSWFTLNVLKSIVYTIICGGFINLFITGINQITDIEIDRINKPTLPLASEELSKTNAIIVVSISMLIGIVLAILSKSFYLFMVVISSIIIGTLYSVPPFRLKRFPLFASLCIIFVRGFIINMGFYGHALITSYGINPTTLNLFKDLKCMSATLYFSIFGAIISIFKDIPDIKGDLRNGIYSLSVRLGVRKMFKIGNRMIQSLLLITGIACWITIPINLNLKILPKLFILFLIYETKNELYLRAKKVNPEKSDQVYLYYMYLWKIFYFSYLILPLLCF